MRYCFLVVIIFFCSIYANAEITVSKHYTFTTSSGATNQLCYAQAAAAPGMAPNYNPRCGTFGNHTLGVHYAACYVKGTHVQSGTFIYRGRCTPASNTDGYHWDIYVFANSEAASCPLGMTPDSEGKCEQSIEAVANNYGSSSNNTCHPINIPTGNKYYREGDAALPTSLSLTRAYNSASRSWQFNYTQSLVIDSAQIAVYRPDGQMITFTLDNDDWIAPSQRQEHLEALVESYRLTLSNNTVETYDNNGRLVSIAPVSGPETQLHYTGNQVVISRLGHSFTLEKDSSDRIVKATLPGNQEITYSYSAVGDVTILTQVTYTDLTTRQYHYEDSRFPGFITGITDSAGNRIASVSYDDQGRAISSETGNPNSGIDRTEITYNTDGTRTVKNSLGKEAIYHFTDFNGEYKLTQIDGQPSTHCAAANQNYTYDANGFMASKTDWNGTVTTYVHNAKGQETSRVEASGTPQARTISTEWHSDFNLPVTITEPKRITRFTYDTQGRLLNRLVEPRS